MLNTAKLITLNNNGEDGIVFKPELLQKYINIGSDINCDIRLINAKKLHAKISLLNDDKSVILINMSKTNPVQINNVIVKNDIKLNHNDIIQVLDKKLRWEYEEQGNTTDANICIDKTTVNTESTPNEKNILKTPKTEPVKSKYNFSKFKPSNISDINARKLNLMSEKRITYHRALGGEIVNNTILETNEEEINKKGDENESPSLKLDEDYPLFQKHRMPIHASTPMCNQFNIKNDFKKKLNKLNNSGTLILSYSSCNENDTLTSTTPKRDISTRAGRAPRTPRSIYGTPKSQISNLNSSSVILIDEAIGSQSAFFKLRDKTEPVDLINFSKNCTTFKDATTESLDESILSYKTPDVTSSMYLIDLKTPATALKTPIKTPNKVPLKNNTSLIKSALKNLAKSTTKSSANNTAKSKLNFDNKNMNITNNKSTIVSNVKSSPRLSISINKSLNKSTTVVKENKSDCIVINDSINVTDEIGNSKSQISENNSEIITIEDSNNETTDNNDTVKENCAKSLVKDSSVSAGNHETNKMEINKENYNSHDLNKTFEIETNDENDKNAIDVIENLNRTFEVENASFSHIDSCKYVEFMDVLDDTKNADFNAANKDIIEESVTKKIDDTDEIDSKSIVSLVNTEVINEGQEIVEKMDIQEETIGIDNKSIISPVQPETLSKQNLLGKDDEMAIDTNNEKDQLVENGNEVMDNFVEEIVEESVIEETEVLEPIGEIVNKSNSINIESLDKSENEIISEMDVLEVDIDVENKSISNSVVVENLNNSMEKIVDDGEVISETVEMANKSIISPVITEIIDELSEDSVVKANSEVYEELNNLQCINEEVQLVKNGIDVMDHIEKEIVEEFAIEEAEVLEELATKPSLADIECLDKSDNEIIVEMDVLEVTVDEENKSTSNSVVVENLNKSMEKIVDDREVIPETVEMANKSIISSIVSENFTELNEDLLSKSNMEVPEEINNLDCFEEDQLIADCNEIIDESVIIDECSKDKSDIESFEIPDDINNLNGDNEVVLDEDFNVVVEESEQKIMETEDLKSTDDIKINSMEKADLSEVSDTNILSHESVTDDIADNLDQLSHTIEEGQLTVSLNDNDNSKQNSEKDINLSSDINESEKFINKSDTEDLESLDYSSSINDESELIADSSVEIDESMNEITENVITDDVEITEVSEQTAELENKSIISSMISESIDELNEDSITKAKMEVNEELNNLECITGEDHLIGNSIDAMDQFEEEIVEESVTESDDLEEIFEIGKKTSSADIESLDKSENEIIVEMDVLEVTVDAANNSIINPVEAKHKTDALEQHVEIENKSITTVDVTLDKEENEQGVEISEETNNIDSIQEELQSTKDASVVFDVAEKSSIEVLKNNSIITTVDTNIESIKDSINETLNKDVSIIQNTIEDINSTIEEGQLVVSLNNKSVNETRSKEDSFVSEASDENKTIVESDKMIDNSCQKEFNAEEVEFTANAEELVNNDIIIENMAAEVSVSADVAITNKIIDQNKTVEIASEVMNNSVESDNETLNEVNGINSVIEKSSKLNNVTNYIGLKEIMNTPKCSNKLDDMRGVKEMFNTPYKNELTDLLGVKEMMNTPSACNNVNLVGVKDIFKTPKDPNNLTIFDGVRELVKTPKIINKTLNLSGINEMMATPNAVIENGNESKTIINEKSKFKNNLYKTAIMSNQVSLLDRLNNQEDEKISVESVCYTNNLELTNDEDQIIGNADKSINNDSQKEANSSASKDNTSIKNENNEVIMVINVSGRKISLSTSKTEIITIEPEVVKQNQSDEMNPEEIDEEDVKIDMMSPIVDQSVENKSAEKLFDEFVGKPIVKFTYSRKTDSPKKQLNLTPSHNTTLDLPKTDIELWLDSVPSSTPQSKLLKPIFFEKRTNPTTQILSSLYSNVTTSKNETSIINHLNETSDKTAHDDVAEKSINEEINNENQSSDAEEEKKVSAHVEKNEKVTMAVDTPVRSLRTRGKKVEKPSDSIKVLSSKKIKQKAGKQQLTEEKLHNTEDLSPQKKKPSKKLNSIMEPTVNIIKLEATVVDNADVVENKTTNRMNRRNKNNDDKEISTVETTDEEDKQLKKTIPQNQKSSRKRIYDDGNATAEILKDANTEILPKIKKSMRNKMKIEKIKEEFKEKVESTDVKEKLTKNIKSKDIKIIIATGKRSHNISDENIKQKAKEENESSPSIEKLNEKTIMQAIPVTNDDALLESSEVPQKKQKKNLVKSNIIQTPIDEPNLPKRRVGRKDKEIIEEHTMEQEEQIIVEKTISEKDTVPIVRKTSRRNAGQKLIPTETVITVETPKSKGSSDEGKRKTNKKNLKIIEEDASASVEEEQKPEGLQRPKRNATRQRQMSKTSSVRQSNEEVSEHSLATSDDQSQKRQKTNNKKIDAENSDTSEYYSPKSRPKRKKPVTTSETSEVNNSVKKNKFVKEEKQINEIEPEIVLSVMKRGRTRLQSNTEVTMTPRTTNKKLKLQNDAEHIESTSKVTPAKVPRKRKNLYNAGSSEDLAIINIKQNSPDKDSSDEENKKQTTSRRKKIVKKSTSASNDNEVPQSVIKARPQRLLTKRKIIPDENSSMEEATTPEISEKKVKNKKSDKKSKDHVISEDETEKNIVNKRLPKRQGKVIKEKENNSSVTTIIAYKEEIQEESVSKVKKEEITLVVEKKGRKMSNNVSKENITIEVIPSAKVMKKKLPTKSNEKKNISVVENTDVLTSGRITRSRHK